MSAAPHRPLENLLGQLFEPDELRRFLLGLGGSWAALVAELPSGTVSKAELAHQAALRLVGRGLSDARFFAALVEGFPRREAEIREVERGLARASTAATAQAGVGPKAGVRQKAEARAELPWRPLRVLHLSDLHFDEKTAWDAGTVLGRLAGDVARLRSSVGALDLVVVTGDVANRGKASEYAAALRWLDGPLRVAAGVGRERVRLVPGNHDVDRGAITRTARGLAANILEDKDAQQAAAEVLGDAGERAPLLQRKTAWQDFAREFHPSLQTPWWSETLPLGPWKVHLAGFDSALLSGSDQDRGQLLLSRWQCNQLLEGAEDADLCVALLHHPWDYLTESDRGICEEEIRRRCGVILHGHLHQQRARLASDPDRDVLQLAAGACYAGSGWSNSYQLLELDPGCGEARVHFRVWDGHDWIPDRNRYQEAKDGVASLSLRKSLRPSAEAAPPPLPSEPEPDPEARLRALITTRVSELPTIFEAPGHRHALQDVYVELQLSPESLPPGCERELREVHRIDRITDALDHPVRRWALLGEAGCGKTTLLHHLAGELLKEGRRLPVPLRVAELQRGDRLRDAVTRAYDAEAAALVARACAAGRAVILLDGLDEAVVPDDARNAITSLAVDAGSAALIVSSRDTAYTRPGGGFGELRVLPLTDAQQAALLGGWVGPTRAREELERVGRRPRLARMAKNPLLLTLMGLVLLRDEASRPGQPVRLPERRSDLYERAVGLLLRGLHRPALRLGFPDPPLVRETLARLALTLHGQEQTTWPLSRLREVIEADPRAWPRIEARWQSVDRFLQDVAAISDLLVPEGPKGDASGYRFPHRTFREHLASVALADDIGRNGLGDVPPAVLSAVAQGKKSRKKLSLPPGELNRVLTEGVSRPETWAEVLALTAGQLGEGGPDRLVRRVAASGDRRLLLRVVAESEGLHTDTLDAALAMERGWQRWEARKKILEDLPGLVGDPAAAVSLLRRFTATTTDGNDLYWIREGLSAIAAGTFPGAVVEPWVRAEAQEGIARIFDHLSKERLEQAKALLGPWWRTVPPGGERLGPYKLGSEEYDEEKPAHDVTLTARLSMLAVPVTWEMYLRFDPGHVEAQGEFEGTFRKGEAQTQVPVYRVTWYAATMFAAWVGARLPAEAEWELACRAGTTTRYWSGDQESDLARVGWFYGNSGGHPHPVGQKPANPWGLHDVHGNVLEWCLDGYQQDAYASRRAGLTVDPAGKEGPTYAVGGSPPVSAESAARGDLRVLRGGSWYLAPGVARSADRVDWHPSDSHAVGGFRLVLPVAVPEPG